MEWGNKRTRRWISARTEPWRKAEREGANHSSTCRETDWFTTTRGATEDVAAASGHSAGQTAEGAVTGSAAGTDYCCSPNKAFIARMCVHDPKESRVTAVRASSEGTGLFSLDRGLSDMSELIEEMCCRSGGQRTRHSQESATTKLSLNNNQIN